MDAFAARIEEQLKGIANLLDGIKKDIGKVESAQADAARSHSDIMNRTTAAEVRLNGLDREIRELKDKFETKDQRVAALEAKVYTWAGAAATAGAIAGFLMNRIFGAH